MMATQQKRRGEHDVMSRLEESISILDAEIRATKARLQSMRLGETRARCKVDLVSRSAERERKERDSSRSAQQWANAHKQLFSQIAEDAERDIQFYQRAQKRSMGAEEIIKIYKSRVKKAEQKAASANAEAQRYSHIGYHSFDVSVIAGFSTDKDALNESRRNLAEVQRRYNELIKNKKKLQRQLAALRRKA